MGKRESAALLLLSSGYHDGCYHSLPLPHGAGKR